MGDEGIGARVFQEKKLVGVAREVSDGKIADSHDEDNHGISSMARVGDLLEFTSPALSRERGIQTVVVAIVRGVHVWGRRSGKRTPYDPSPERKEEKAGKVGQFVGYDIRIGADPLVNFLKL